MEFCNTKVPLTSGCALSFVWFQGILQYEGSINLCCALSFVWFQGILQYEGPLNPTRNNNHPTSFSCSGNQETVTLDEKWETILSKRLWEAELGDFTEAHNLEGLAFTSS